MSQTITEFLSSLFLRVQRYDPYNPESSECEPEMPYGHHLSEHDHDVGHPRYECLSPGRDFHDNYDWESSHSETGRRPLDGHDLSPVIRPTEHRGPSPRNGVPERQLYSPSVEHVDPDYGSISRPRGRRSSSPDTQMYTASYRGQRTSGTERIPVPEFRREVSLLKRM